MEMKEQRRNMMFLTFGLGEEVLKNLKENPSTVKVVLKMAKSSIFTTEEVSNKETSIDIILNMIEDLKLTDKQSVILLKRISKLAELLLKEEITGTGKGQQSSPYAPYQPYMGPSGIMGNPYYTTDISKLSSTRLL